MFLSTQVLDLFFCLFLEKDGCDEIAKRLPERLFATDRFPSERVNMYSTVDFLLWVRDVLRGTPEMELLLGSCFGGLFRTLALRLFAGKVVHSMMTRQVVTKKKYEMWPVFGGKPLRFSLVEFGEVTGLPCSKMATALITNSRRRTIIMSSGGG